MGNDAFCAWGKAAVCLLLSTPLWLVAPPAAGDPPAKPERAAKLGISISDITITRADAQTAEGFFTVTNNTSGGHSVQVEQMQMAWQWIGQKGVRASCSSVRFATSPVTQGSVIPGGAQVRVDYQIACDRQPSFAPREIKNFVAIKLVGRSKIFSSSGSFKLDGTTTTPPSTTRFEESAATATGSWQLIDSQTGTFSGGTAAASNDASTPATGTFTFTGTAISWIGSKCNVCGIARVSIDGGTPSDVNTAGPNAPGSMTSESVFSASGLASGVSHTIVITVTGRTSSGDAFIVVDAFDVTQ